MNIVNKRKKAVISLTPGSVLLGKEICHRMGEDYHFYYPQGREKGGFPYTGLKKLLPELFKNSEYEALICIMATGIVFRILGPYAEKKDKDPAVIVADEKGEFFINLLSGHLGGGNDLCRELADGFKATPVITTATDVRGLTAVDQLARNQAFKIEPLENIKIINSRLLEGKKITIYTDLSLTDMPLGFPPSEYVIRPINSESFSAKGSTCRVYLTSKVVKEKDLKRNLFLRPPNLIVGIGCRRGIAGEAIEKLLLNVFKEKGLSIKSLCCIATGDIKADEPGIHWVAKKMGLPLKIIDRSEIKRADIKYTSSDFVLTQTGVGGICEPTAILAAGKGDLIVPKTSGQGITVAVARVKSGW